MSDAWEWIELLAVLRAQLAAVEKERDEAADSYEITLVRMAENCTERQGERDALAVRVARLEAALEPTPEGRREYVAALMANAEFDETADAIMAMDGLLHAIRARAGLDDKKGNRG